MLIEHLTVGNVANSVPQDIVAYHKIRRDIQQQRFPALKAEYLVDCPGDACQHDRYDYSYQCFLLLSRHRGQNYCAVGLNFLCGLDYLFEHLVKVAVRGLEGQLLSEEIDADALNSVNLGDSRLHLCRAVRAIQILKLKDLLHCSRSFLQ